MAVDGGLLDTAPARAAALVEAAHTQGMRLEAESVALALDGRTLDEAVAVLLPEVATQDPTLIDLISHAAERMVLRYLLQASIDATRVAELRDAGARGNRIVLRSDGRRQTTEPLVAAVGVEAYLTMLCCADDPWGATSRTAANMEDPSRRSCERSWQAIAARCALWRVSSQACTVVEASVATARIAAHVAAPWIGALHPPLD